MPAGERSQQWSTRGGLDGWGECGGREGPKRVGPSPGWEGWRGWQRQEVHSGTGAPGVSVGGRQFLVMTRTVREHGREWPMGGRGRAAGKGPGLGVDHWVEIEIISDSDGDARVRLNRQ